MDVLVDWYYDLELPANQLVMSYYYRTQLIILNRLLELVKTKISEAEVGLREWDTEDI